MTGISAIEQAVREERMAVIDRCRRCDPCGWLHGPDDTPIDPAVRCTHGAPAVRGITAPIHEPGLFSEPLHPTADTEEWSR